MQYCCCCVCRLFMACCACEFCCSRVRVLLSLSRHPYAAAAALVLQADATGDAIISLAFTEPVGMITMGES